MRIGPASGYGAVWPLVGSHNVDGMVLSAAGGAGIFLAAKVRAERVAAGDSEGQIAAAVRLATEGDWTRRAELAREIFGNPFRPLPKRKFPAEVVGLAQACYDDHAHYPLLADALDDLSEADAAAHCRQPGHVRGCHVVDWVLGRV